jgi:hypothetical protein
VARQFDPRLREFADAREISFLEAVEKHGKPTHAAKALGIHHSVLIRALESLEKRAAKQGYSPAHDLTHVVPDGYLLKGASTYYNKDGEKAGQWIKTDIDRDRQAAILREFAESLADGVKALAPITPAPSHVISDLLCVYPQGDPHVGLHSWWAEAGEDFDLKIAERLMCAAVDRLVATAPAAETALLLNLGDMFHADNQRNESQSGHKLDVDGRWAKVQQVGLRAMLHCVRRLLEKHKRVILRINRGNHDGHSAYALALMISCYFHDEPRVEVDLSPAVAWYFQFGKVLIGSTHGDTLKGPDMLPIMAADEPEKWGETKHRYWYVGHVHHQDIKEYRGGTVEYFRTLAARDAWHAGQGYRAGRDMRLIVLHREHGEIERHRADIGMLEAA